MGRRIARQPPYSNHSSILGAMTFSRPGNLTCEHALVRGKIAPAHLPAKLKLLPQRPGILGSTESFLLPANFAKGERCEWLSLVDAFSCWQWQP